MKIVVFSDVHGNRDAVKRIISFNPVADHIISLGDSELPTNFLLDLDILAIKGNYPRDGGFLYEKFIELEDRKILLTHGHKHGVQNGLLKLIKYATANDVSLVLYGHTHVPKVDEISGIMYINPGSINSPRTHIKPSYLILTITKTAVTCSFRDAETNLVIEDIE